MTNTLTTDEVATTNQILALENAGADLVRVSCPDEDSTKSLKKIIKMLMSLSLQIFIFIIKDFRIC